MPRIYKFQSNWLKRKDSLGYLISSWCVKVDNKNSEKHELHCNICLTNFSHARKGFTDIIQHVNTAKHNAKAKEKLNDKQLKLQINTSNTDERSQNPLKLCSNRDLSAKAEILWCLKNVHSDFSSNSCDGLGNIFSAMFPDSKIAQDFSLSPKKLNYIITDALFPYFQEKLISDIQKSLGCSVSFDETTNSESRKELQIRLRYFSETEEEVVDHHLKTSFLGSATAKVLEKELIDTLQICDLSIDKLIMLGSDGPNVNKSVWNKINEHVLQDRGKGLVNIGTCNLHVIDNSFTKGLNEFGDECSDFSIKIYYFFHERPVRIEDFERIQQKVNLPLHRFIKHSSTRWTTLKSSCLRIVEQYSALKEYFLKFLLSEKRFEKLLATQQYQSIRVYLQQSDMLAKLHFVIDSATLFEGFSLLFQKDEPLIHILFDKIEHLLLTLAGRICEAKSIEKFKINKLSPKELFESNHLVNEDSIVLNAETKSNLRNMNQKEKLIFLFKVKNHYKAAAEHIISKSSLQAYPHSSLLYHMRCLQPTQICNSNSVNAIVKILERLPLKNVSTSTLVDEWKMLQIEKLPESDNTRIDHFWAKNVFKRKCVTSDDLKFPLVSKIVKICLSITHGNADVERGFSKSHRILTEDKTAMKERTLNARLTTFDATEKFKNKLELFPVSQDMLTKAHLARKTYLDYLEAEKNRQQKEEEKKKKEMERLKEVKKNLEKLQLQSEKVKDLEIQLKSMRQERDLKETNRNYLLEKANKELQEAIKNNNLVCAHAANEMLLAAEKLRKDQEKLDTEILSLSKEIESKRHKVLKDLMRRKKSEYNKIKNLKDNLNIKQSTLAVKENITRKRKSNLNKERFDNKKSKTDNKNSKIEDKKSKTDGTKSKADDSSQLKIRNETQATVNSSSKDNLKNKNLCEDNNSKKLKQILLDSKVQNVRTSHTSFVPFPCEKIKKKKITIDDLL